jgi:hypothetical protein
MSRTTFARATGLALALATWSLPAHALDLPNLLDKPLRLDVTETSIFAQHFGARTGEDPAAQGYAAWLNRLNLALKWGRWTVGLRLDSALYGNRPQDQLPCSSGTLLPCLTPDQVALQQSQYVPDGASRYRDSIYPAKVWLNYTAPGLEVTLGDAYVQFGRGLLLSMRKIDELGIDTTLRGAKVEWQSDPFAVTVVAGIANPTRVDEATGRALFLPNEVAPGPRIPNPPGTTYAQPLFGSDRIVGAEIQAGRGLPVALTTHAMRLTRCSPVHYDAAGNVYNGLFDAPLGSCDPNDTAIWLSTLPKSIGPALVASEIEMVGQGVEIPSLWGHGKIYVEGAMQHRHRDDKPDDTNADGNAVYGSLSANAGPVTNTLEIKSYRNFYPLQGAVDQTRAIEFNNVVYSIPPTTELITQDSEFGYFSVCVDGGRLRTDVRLADEFLVYGTAAYYHSKSEVSGGTCDSKGHSIGVSGVNADTQQTYVWDGVGGIEWFFDQHLSHLFASTGARDDRLSSGDPFYHELHAEYAFTKHLTGPYSLELSGRHRLRYEQGQNIRLPGGFERPWHEGENYTALKVSPKWIFSQGVEYLTNIGYPTYYFNGSVRWNFRSDSSIVLFVGEQRGGLRCVSGVCKVFPPFEGARAELTLRF